MSRMRIKTGVVVVLGITAILFSGTAYGQSFERNLPGTISRTGNGGVVCPGTGYNNNNRMVDPLLGVIIGGFLGYMIGTNQSWDEDNYYDRDRDRDHDRNFDRRGYEPSNRRYDRRPPLPPEPRNEDRRPRWER